MITALQLAYTLPDPMSVVAPATQPIIYEIVTKYVPVAGAVGVGLFAIKRLGGR